MTMDPRHQYILRKLQPTIVKDLEVTSIIDKLMSRGIVSSALWEEIKRETSSESESRKLLDILPKRGPEAYSVFKEAVRVDYPWIVKAMEDLEAEDSVDAIDAQLGPHNLYSHLPANPPLSVEREQKMNKLRTGLTELQPGSYLVLHALQGYGKSTLASTTLRDARFVERCFKNEIYWIKFGQHQSVSENKLIQLNVLFHHVRNLDPLTEPTSEDSLKYSLKRHFSSHNYALIILDDVNSQEVIEAFDFGCKTLVLTTDVEILRGKSSNVIEMCDGFSANESLNLFSKATGIPVSELPEQARQIHEECKGMPLMISMFSAQFEEIKESLIEGKTSDEIWSYYLNALREKSPNVFQESLERRAATFDLCIEKLSPEDKHYYKTLAIFPEDVNIPTMTLSIFWDVKLAEVNSRMLRFRKKSLACRKWHSSCQTYVYGVHNLLLSHLRDKLTPEELKSLHRSYVNKNLAICQRDFSKLPTDNYIHSYIGYHMKKGELLDEFSKIYLNFGFIEAKVFNIGTGDLLIDLKKYRNYITRNSPELLEEVEDLEKFLVQQAPTLAEYRRRNCLDLVQVALKHPFQGFVRRTAECLANERQSRLYLNHLKHNTEYPNSYSEELHLQVRSVAFTNEAEVILVGNDEGKVISWNCNNRQHVTFGGNNAEQPITKIVAPEKEKFFISISGDGRAKLFDLRGEWNRQTTDDHIKTLPPIAKQPEWINMSESKSSQDDSRITFDVPEQKIIDIAVSTEGRKIAACTDSGAVVAWDFNGNPIISYQLASRAPLISIAFTMSSTILITVDGSSKALLILDASNGQYKSQMSLNPETDKIISLLSVPKYCNILLVLLETKICSLIWAMNGDPYQGPHIEKFAELGENGTYTSAAVTRDGRYIVTADTGGSVNICNLHEGLEVVRTYKNLIFSLDTHWLEDEACHIICGGNRDSLVPMVHRWKFDPQAKPVVRRLPLFDATMEPCERNVIAIGTSNGTVQIIQNDGVIAETPAVDGKITSLLIYNDGNQVVYGTDKGSVFLFDIKHKNPKEIMELCGPIDFLKTLKIRGEDVIVCKKLGEKDVQIWKSPDYTEMVENTGSVIYCDTITSVERVLTVSDRVIKIFDQYTWKTHSKYEPKSVHKINCCSLSSKQNYLALANGTGNFNVSKLITRPDLRSIKFQEFIVRKLDDGITACDFSQDEELLGLGLKTGEIIIINVLTNSEVRKLQFHRRPVKGLYWCPAEIENRVLLSLADELAWWNVTMESHNEQQREISHSLSELTLRPESKGAVSKIGRMTTSRSLELGSFKQMDKSEFDNNSDVFFDANHGVDLAQSLNGFNGANQRLNPSLWSKKEPKFNKIDGLLSVVKLDDDLATKVCISDRFSHFVTLNGEESIYNLTIFEPRNKETVNGDT